MVWTALSMRRGRTAVSGDNHVINFKEDRTEAMELLPTELRSKLPPLYSQENVKDPVVHIKFFTPDSNWTWYATEGSQEDDDFVFFGYVVGHEKEWGYFVLSEMARTSGPRGFPIERDLYFEPGPFSQVMTREHH